MLPETEECDEKISAVSFKLVVVSFNNSFGFYPSVSKSGMTLNVTTVFVLHISEENIVLISSSSIC